MPAEYPRDLVAQLHATLTAHEWPRAVPTTTQLERLLDVAWAASMHEEEGRATLFTLAFVAPDDVGRYGALQFAKPFAFEPKEIAKLAHATDNGTLIGVRPTAEGELEIWGLVHVGGIVFSIDIENPPLFIRINVAKAGQFTVKDGPRSLVWYAHGKAHWHGDRATVLLTHFLQPVGQYVVDTDEKLRGAGSGSIAHEFQRIAERMVLSGHGGTLIVYKSALDPVPDNVVIPDERRFVALDTTLKDAFASDHHSSPRKSRAERDHIKALDHVAHLAAVDGAVVMQPDLSVLGFGATIFNKNEDVPIFEIDPRDDTPKQVPLTAGAFKGQRHKSGVYFCAHYVAQFASDFAQMMKDREAGVPPTIPVLSVALAIVASQDGDLTVFAATPHGVAVVRPFILPRATQGEH